MPKTVVFLRCIVRNDLIHHYCGYIGISNENVLIINNELEKTIDNENKEWLMYDAIADKISVHGGITFTGTFSKKTSIIPISNMPNDWYKYHYYGFDLDHYGDDASGISTNFEYAVKETLRMKKQLEEFIAQYVPSTGD